MAMLMGDGSNGAEVGSASFGMTRMTSCTHPVSFDTAPAVHVATNGEPDEPIKHIHQAKALSLRLLFFRVLSKLTIKVVDTLILSF